MEKISCTPKGLAACCVSLNKASSAVWGGW